MVRVSRVGDRDGDRFVSPREQAERIAAMAEREGLQAQATVAPGRGAARITVQPRT